jgi:GDP-L-fucose synthase
MNQQSRIFLAGHTGLVGSAIHRQLAQQSYGNLLLRSHKELDLTDQHSTKQFFSKAAPEVVILAAAKVGGIGANTTLPADFVYVNLAIQNNVIQAAAETGIKTLVFLGSSCIYPRDCRQPIKEEFLLSGPLEKTNRPYAIAKIAGIELCWAFNRQFNTRYLSVMPTNLYGPGDNYDRNHSHVIPGLIRKIHEAKENGNEEVLVWGSGTPRREFMYSQDFADACIFLLNKIDDLSDDLFTNEGPPLINVGVGHDLTIQELGQIIGNVIGYQGKFRFDTTKPDGTPRKLLDSRKLTSYGWNAKTSLVDGISCAYDDFLTRYAKSK